MAVQYRLKRSDPIWEVWQTVRLEMIKTLSRYRPHIIRITYNEENMKQVLKNRASAARKKNGG